MQKTNIAELMLNDDVNKLLTLCRGRQQDNGAYTSDYDAFVRFCRCLPLFYGHPIQASAQRYLRSVFDVDLSIIPQNAEKIWQLTAETLLTATDAVPPFLIAEESTTLSVPPLSAGVEYTSFPASFLIQTNANTWRTWQAEMRTNLDQMLAQNPERLIRFDLNECACLQRPTLYHVEQALQKKDRTEKDSALLLAQVLRFACAYAQERGAGLLICSDTPHVAKLLTYCHKEVGLTCALCVTCDEPTQDVLIELIQSTAAPICLGLDYHDFSSHCNFEEATVSLAKKYPLGCVTVLEERKQKHFLIP